MVIYNRGIHSTTFYYDLVLSEESFLDLERYASFFFPTQKATLLVFPLCSRQKVGNNFLKTKLLVVLFL